MKVNQVIDVKPTRTEKEFLRLVLTNVASAEEAPFDVAEKIEFGEVKHTTDYVCFENCHKDVEYSVIIGHISEVRGTSLEYTQWQGTPYIGIASWDDLQVSVLDRKDNEPKLYKWSNESDWAKGFIKNKDFDDDYKLSTEIMHEEVEIPSSESDWVSVSYDSDLYSKVLDVIPGDVHKDLELLRARTQVINSTVYKLHNYEVSYTYEGKTYYAKARAIKESNEVLLASDGIISSPWEEICLDKIVGNKQTPPVILANISWILCYASAATSIILSILGNSSLWYLPFIMTAVAAVVSVVCNLVSKMIGNAVCSEYSAKSRANKILPSLRRGVEKFDLGELTEAETAKFMETFKDPKFPEDKKVEIGGRILVSIFLAIGAAIMAFCFGFAANL